jgi:hypothetical protein
VEAARVGGSNCQQITLVGVLLLLVLVVYRVQRVLPIGKRRRQKSYITICRNVKYAVGTNNSTNSTVERLVVVMRERTTTLESEQRHQMLLHLTYQRVTMTSILESVAQPLNSYAIGRLLCVR